MPSSDLRSSVTDFLLALNWRKYQESLLLALAGRLDLHDLGAEPRQAFGAGRAGLELAEVHDPDAGEAVGRPIGVSVGLSIG
jgi:hypothetical protein